MLVDVEQSAQETHSIIRITIFARYFGLVCICRICILNWILGQKEILIFVVLKLHGEVIRTKMSKNVPKGVKIKIKMLQ